MGYISVAFESDYRFCTAFLSKVFKVACPSLLSQEQDSGPAGSIRLILLTQTVFTQEKVDGRAKTYSKQCHSSGTVWHF